MTANRIFYTFQALALAIQEEHHQPASIPTGPIKTAKLAEQYGRIHAVTRDECFEVLDMPLHTIARMTAKKIEIETENKGEEYA